MGEGYKQKLRQPGEMIMALVDSQCRHLGQFPRKNGHSRLRCQIGGIPGSMNMSCHVP